MAGLAGKTVKAETVLVTGGAGFIGSHVVDLLRDEGFRVVMVDDLSAGRRENLPAEVEFHPLDVAGEEARELVLRLRPRYLVHLAAQVSVSRSVRDPVADARVNVLGTVNLLQAAVRAGVGRFVFASSGGTVYGEPAFLPVPEEAPLRPLSPYGAAKMAGEGYLRVFASQAGLPCVSLRLANVYGPRQDPFGEAGVVAIFATRMLRGEQPVINGDGGYIRDYVYVGDVARAVLSTLGRPMGGECPFGEYNVGTGRGTDVNELFALLAPLCGYADAPRHGPPRPGDLRASVLDHSCARRELGWEPRVTLEEGLARTVAHFRAGLMATVIGRG